MNCRAIAGFLYIREKATLDNSSVLEDLTFQKKIDQFWRKTLGQYVHTLTKISVLTDDIVPVFREAVQARNEIAHNVAMDVSKRLDLELEERLDHILELVRQIAKADKVASTIVHLLNKYPLPTKNFFESYEDRVTSWVKEDTFEN